jgi:transposase
MLIDMPELGAVDNKCAVSLAGLAPMARDSGKWRGKCFIHGGRSELRHALFMPALVAVCFNPHLKRVHEALTEAENRQRSLSSPSCEGS